nr:hypothetical protein [Deltaproteobacteria bacterium]
MLRAPRSLLALLALLAIPTVASAQPSAHPAVSLSYAIGPGVTRCPDAPTLRESIAARLGRDPFTAPSTEPQSHLSITVLRVGRGLRALISWDHGDDSPPALREVASSTDDCSDVVATAALTISLALDASRSTRAFAFVVFIASVAPIASVVFVASASAPVYVPVSAPAQAVAPTVASAPPLPRSRFWAFLGPVVGFGSSPAGDLGAALDLGVASSRLALSLGVRADLPVTTIQSSTGGSVHTQRLQGELALCWHSPLSGDSLHVHACALGVGAVLLGEGLGVDQPRQDTSWIASIGARAMADFRLSRRFGLRVRLDALVPVRRAVVKLDQEVVWEGAWLQGSIALGAVVHFG